MTALPRHRWSERGFPARRVPVYSNTVERTADEGLVGPSNQAGHDERECHSRHGRIPSRRLAVAGVAFAPHAAFCSDSYPPLHLSSLSYLEAQMKGTALRQVSLEKSTTAFFGRRRALLFALVRRRHKDVANTRPSVFYRALVPRMDFVGECKMILTAIANPCKCILADDGSWT